MSVRTNLKTAVHDYLVGLSYFESATVLESDFEYGKVKLEHNKGKALISVAPPPIAVSAGNGWRREIQTIIVGTEFMYKEQSGTGITDLVDTFKDVIKAAFDNNRATLWGEYTDTGSLMLSNYFHRVSLGGFDTTYAPDGQVVAIDFNILVEYTRKTS